MVAAGRAGGMLTQLQVPACRVVLADEQQPCHCIKTHPQSSPCQRVMMRCRVTVGLKPPELKTAYLRNHVKGQVAVEGDFVWHGDPELVLALRPLPKKLGLATVAMQLVSGLVRLQVGAGLVLN